MRAATSRLAVLLLAVLALSACAGADTTASLNPGIAGPQELLADAQLRSGRADLALMGYERGLKFSPGQPGLMLKRSRALLRLGRADEALAGFEQVQARLAADSPDQAVVIQGRGEALYALERLDEAREALSRAVGLAPDSWRARGVLGMVLQALGQPAQAAEQYRTALGSPRIAQLPEATRKAVREELANSLGVALVLAGDLQGGEIIFRKAMSRGLGSERVCNNLGLLLVRLGRPVEALEAFRAAGDEARALNNLGYALLLKGENAKARAMFEKAIETAPAYYETAGENLRRTMLAGSLERPAREAFPGVAGISLSVPGREAPTAVAVAEGAREVRLTVPGRDLGVTLLGQAEQRPATQAR